MNMIDLGVYWMLLLWLNMVSVNVVYVWIIFGNVGVMINGWIELIDSISCNGLLMVVLMLFVGNLFLLFLNVVVVDCLFDGDFGVFR